MPARESGQQQLTLEAEQPVDSQPTPQLRLHTVVQSVMFVAHALFWYVRVGQFCEEGDKGSVHTDIRSTGPGNHSQIE